MVPRRAGFAGRGRHLRRAVGAKRRPEQASAGRSAGRSGRRWRWRRRRRGRRGGCARRGPAGPRSCGCWWTPPARPGASLSGFMARHIEQPGSRQSKPAAVNTRSSPSASACCFTANEPGTTRVRTPVLHLAALGHRGGGPQVLDARVGAAADEHRVDRDVAHRGAGGEPHVLQGAGGAVALVRVGEVVGGGDGAVERHDLGGVGPPGHVRRDGGGVEVHLLVEGGALVGGQRCASRPAPPPTPRPSARGRGPRGRRR